MHLKWLPSYLRVQRWLCRLQITKSLGSSHFINCTSPSGTTVLHRNDDISLWQYLYTKWTSPPISLSAYPYSWRLACLSAWTCTWLLEASSRPWDACVRPPRERRMVRRLYGGDMLPNLNILSVSTSCHFTHSSYYLTSSFTDLIPRCPYASSTLCEAIEKFYLVRHLQRTSTVPPMHCGSRRRPPVAAEPHYSSHDILPCEGCHSRRQPLARGQGRAHYRS